MQACYEQKGMTLSLFLGRLLFTVFYFFPAYYLLHTVCVFLSAAFLSFLICFLTSSGEVPP